MLGLIAEEGRGVESSLHIYVLGLIAEEGGGGVESSLHIYVLGLIAEEGGGGLNQACIYMCCV